MSRATFNRVTSAIAERASSQGLPLEPFTVHDLRRTASTLLHEMGFNSDWIEKGLAHEERSSRGVYNRSVPSKLTEEVLLVDLLQNVDRLAESRAELLPRALHGARSMNAARLFKAARDFGSVRAERLLSQALQAA